MSLLDRIKEIKPEKAHNTEMNDAIKTFKKQSEQIKAIKDSSGFQEIVAFWERVQTSSETLLKESTDQTDKQVLTQARLQRQNAIEFLGFLTSRLK